MNRHLFRAVWPITHGNVGALHLIAQGATDLPTLMMQTRAIVAVRYGKWYVARSDTVPGSGRVTAYCLVFEAPASPRAARRAAA